MGDPKPTDREKQCVHLLASLFRSGKREIYNPREQILFDGVKLEQTEFEMVMATMEAWGVISNVAHKPPPYSFISITAKSTNKAREFDAFEQAEKEPKDIVEQITQSARKHRWIATLIVAIIVITALATLGEKIVFYLKLFGVLDAN